MRRPGHQDAEWARGVFGALRAAYERGSACLVATHNEELLKFVDRVLMMHDGRLTEAFGARPDSFCPKVFPGDCVGVSRAL